MSFADLSPDEIRATVSGLRESEVDALTKRIELLAQLIATCIDEEIDPPSDMVLRVPLRWLVLTATATLRMERKDDSEIVRQSTALLAHMLVELVNDAAGQLAFVDAYLADSGVSSADAPSGRAKSG